MEGIAAAFVGACIGAALFGALTAKCAIEACRSVLRKNRAMEASGGNLSFAQGVLARGVPFLGNAVDRLVGVRVVDRYVVSLQDALSATGLTIGKRAVVQWLLISVLFVALLSGLLSGSLVCAVA